MTTTDPPVNLWSLLDPKPGWCCEDAYASGSRGDPPTHTSGCRNRCGTFVPVPDARARGLVAAYPCGWSVGHAGDHWLHPSYRLPEPTDHRKPEGNPQ